MRIKKLILFLTGVLIFAGIPGQLFSAPQDFSLVLFPDTQKYAHYDGANPSTYDTYATMAQWVVDNEYDENIKYVIHLGDITDDNKTFEWETVDEAHDILDSVGIPNIMTLGNHDYKPTVRSRNSKFKNYFTSSRLNPAGSFSSNNENYYRFFTVGSGSDALEFMIMTLEFSPRKDVVAWANEVITDHPDKRVLIATHSYLDETGAYNTRHSLEAYLMTGREGADLWRELIKRHSNIFMVVCGHICGAAHNEKTSVFYRSNGSQYTNTVFEVLADYQCEKVKNNSPAYGNGWMRLLTFRPEYDQIDIRTVSAEAGNLDIFSGGIAWLYGSYYEEDENTPITVNYDMTSPVTYLQNISDHRFRDMTVNTIADGQQKVPEIAGDANGNFVVTWEDDRDGNGYYQVYAKGYDVDGNLLFDEFVVNAVSNGQQRNPQIAMAANGAFVITWEDDDNKNGYYNIKARGFDANGGVIIPEFTVNTDSAGQQRYPHIAMDSYGKFVIVWEDDTDNNKWYQIKMRGFNPGGSQRFSQRTVNTVSAGQQYKPAVAMDSNGDFVVVFEDDQDKNGYYEILGRGFNSYGSQRFSQRKMNYTGSGQQRDPSIAMDANGNFVVVWEDDMDNNKIYNIYGRGFYANGTQKIPHFRANANADGEQKNPHVSMTSNGKFIVVWQDDNDNNGKYQVKVSGYFSSGTRSFADKTVNYVASGQQKVPAVVFSDNNYFITAWHDDMDANGKYQVLARNLYFYDY